MHRFLTLAVVIIVLTPGSAIAEQIKYAFTGTVTFASGPPFGNTIPSLSSVSGHFAYESSSPATHVLANGVGYEQHITDGFVGDFAGVSVHADDYVVQVSNNVPQPGGTNADIVAITFSSALSPSLGSPLVVNGVGQGVGLFSVNFVGSGDLFNDTSLPDHMSLTDFPSTLSFLSDTPTGLVDVLFTVNTLTRVSEPSSFSLLLCAMGALAYAGRHVAIRRT